MADRKSPAKTAPQIPADIAKMTFEDALEALENIVRQLETGDGKLEDAIGAYERGAHLKRHCEQKLKEAKTRVERISMNADGAVSAIPEETE
jgi:exodeoxyribonuclease VII small subunit